MFVTKVRKDAKGVLDVHGGWVMEGMEVGGEEGEMMAWMGTVGWETLEAEREVVEGEAFERVVGLLDEAEGVVKREVYHVELS